MSIDFKKKAKEQRTTDASSKLAVQKQSAAMPVATTPNIDFAADAGAGMEGAGVESFVIPMLFILQSGSPQVKASSGKLVEGAKEGMFFETVGEHLHDGKEGVLIVPCAYRRVFLRWSADDAFQGEVAPEEVAKMQASGQVVEVDRKLCVVGADGKADPEKCSTLTDARNHYVLIVDQETGAMRQALISLRSTQIKKSRMLMTSLVSIKVKGPAGAPVTPPTYASLVRCTTMPESNDEGDWVGWQFRMEGFVTDPMLYAEAKKFHKAVTAGQVKAEPAEAMPSEGGKGF